MAFVRIHESINEKSWFLKLTPEVRSLYLQLLIYSSKGRGCIETADPWVLARKLELPEKLVKDGLEILQHQTKIEVVNNKILVCNYSIYNSDPKNAERQAQFKQRAKSKVTGGNGGNGGNAPIPEPIPLPEPSPPKPPAPTQPSPALAEAGPGRAAVETLGNGKAGGAVSIAQALAGFAPSRTDPDEWERWKQADLKRVLAEQRAAAQSQREAEFAVAQKRAERDAVDFTEAFAELIPNCTDQTKANIHTAVKKLPAETVQTILTNTVEFVNSGQARSPEKIILHRLRNP